MADPDNHIPGEIKLNTGLPEQFESLPAIQLDPCYCIGCGSSIRGLDFSLLKPYYTIGCNHVMLDYYVDCGVFLDRSFYDDYHTAIPHLTCEIWSHKRAVPDGYSHPRVKLIETSLNGINTDMADPSWVMGHLSGIAAINIAYLKGYREIYLLGYDMQGSNYHDTEEVPFARSNKLIYKFTRFLEIDAKIYNCNQDSYLEVFPKVREHPAFQAR